MANVIGWLWCYSVEWRLDYFVRGGYVKQDTSEPLNYAGDRGVYWSSTPRSTTDRAYRLDFWSAGELHPSNYAVRQYAWSLRCLAR